MPGRKRKASIPVTGDAKSQVENLDSSPSDLNDSVVDNGETVPTTDSEISENGCLVNEEIDEEEKMINKELETEGKEIQEKALETLLFKREDAMKYLQHALHHTSIYSKHLCNRIQANKARGKKFGLNPGAVSKGEESATAAEAGALENADELSDLSEAKPGPSKAIPGHSKATLGLGLSRANHKAIPGPSKSNPKATPGRSKSIPKATLGRSKSNPKATLGPSKSNPKAIPGPSKATPGPLETDFKATPRPPKATPRPPKATPGPSSATPRPSSAIPGPSNAIPGPSKSSECSAGVILEEVPNHPVLFTGGQLQPHQVEGFKWLKTLYENGLNGILADEMGLGKTIQSIAMIAYLISMGVGGPFLVCGPLSTIGNWYAEFKRFCPEIPLILYHGNKEKRKELRVEFEKQEEVRDFSCCPVVITSYSMILHDATAFRGCIWNYFVIDEGHRIKNYECSLLRVLKTLEIQNHLLLTGTPLQNNLGELWSLLNFALPKVFNDPQGFQSLLDVAFLSSSEADKIIITEEQKEHFITGIHQILTPFVLRRTKSDVNLNIPRKKEVYVYAPVTSLQERYYNAIRDKSIENVLNPNAGCKCDYFSVEADLPKRKRKKVNYLEIESTSDEDFYAAAATVSHSVPAITPGEECKDDVFVMVNVKMSNVLMQLRKACLHPYLLARPAHFNSGDLVKNSGKMMVLDAMLYELKKRGHKVLIFSQFVIMLDILSEYCEMRGFEFSRLDGSTVLEDRLRQMQHFNTSASSFLFLLSTRAGGLGVNLTAADTVIIFDSDWNPQNDLQAQDRCHRFGQTKPVVVYRLVTENTVEQTIIERAAAKRKLERLIMVNGRFSSSDTLSKAQKPISEDELIALLQASDASASIRCNKKNIFTKKELDALLDRADLLKKE